MNEERKQEMADAHWMYIEGLLKAHGLGNTTVIRYHYITAFIHGYGHGHEDAQNEHNAKICSNAITNLRSE
jgi:hypothetical protein